MVATRSRCQQPEAAEIAALFAKLQDHVRQTWPGSTVVEQIEIRLGAAGGHSLRLQVDDGSRLLTTRMYYQDNRFYELIAVTAAAEHEGPVVTRFLNALRILR